MVKGAGIFCVNVCVGCRQYPPCDMVWCGGCYVKNPKDDSPKYGKYYVGYWEGELDGGYEEGISHDHKFSV